MKLKNDPSTKWANLISSMEEITIDSKAVVKLLGGLNRQHSPGPDGLNTRVLKECGSKITPIRVIIFNGSINSSGQCIYDAAN